MKVFAFTDLHGDMDLLKKIKKSAKEADVVVSSGDITVFEDRLDKVVQELDNIGKPVIIIHGNHEFDETMREACEKTKNVKFIHETHHEMDKVLFLGYGGGGFRFETHEFKEIGKKFKDIIKDHKVIFLIHGPPYNTEVDKVIDDHVGNLTMREFIEEVGPDIVVCGHLHENFGKHDIINESYIINPGPEGRLLEV